MIDQLITALSKEIEMSAEEIADTIWLALQMQEFQAESVSSDFPITKEDERRISQSEQETLPKAEPKTSELEETPNQPPEEQKAGIYPRTQQQTSKSLDLSFKAPDAPSLRDPLTLARALKPLMRRIPSGRELVLDEAATIQRIADEGLWIPVLRPTLEPWLDLELVVDEAISMQIWRHTIRELERLLKNYGIFRDVRIWGLITDGNEQVQIRRGIGATAKNQTSRSPNELIDPSGRRLVLVVSDCVSSLWWHNEQITPVLERWAKQGSIAIVQMLPKWLWKRTALGRASEVQLRGLTPGVFNQKLIAKEVSLWDELEEETGVKVPVFTLEPDKVVTWAQMLSGKGSIWTSGYVFKLDSTLDKKESGLFNLAHGELSAEQRVQAFRVTASPMARKLAGLLASAPVISLPIVRLIQETVLKESQQIHVAEVFLGGLLKPLSEINVDTNPDYVQYEFMDGVRELLVDSVPSNYVLNVVNEVSKFVAEKVGLSLETFAAVLRNPQQAKDREIVEEVGYFATVMAQVLRRLGGEYARFADEMEAVRGDFRAKLNPPTGIPENLPFGDKPTILNELLKLHPQLTEKARVDYVNGLEVLDDHLRFRDWTNKKFLTRIWDSITGRTAQRQQIIDGNITNSLKIVSVWLQDIQLYQAKSDIAVARLAGKLQETRTGVMRLQERHNELAENVQAIAQDVDRLQIQVQDHRIELESQIRQVNAGRLASDHLEEVFDKWQAGRLNNYPPLARLYIVIDELYWGYFGIYCRSQFGTNEVHQLMELLRNKAWIQMKQDLGGDVSQLMLPEEWLSPIKNLPEELREVLSYSSNWADPQTAPVTWAIRNAALLESGLPDDFPRVLSGEHAINHLIDENKKRIQWNMTTKPYRVGLVLSGGGARGAYHVGVIKYLADMNISIDVVAGASIGALNGAVVAAEPNLKIASTRLQEIWNSLAANSPIKINTTETINYIGKILLSPVAPLIAGTSDALSTVANLQTLFSENVGLGDESPIHRLLDRYLDLEKLQKGLPLYVSVYRSQGSLKDYFSAILASVNLINTRSSEFLHIQSLKRTQQRIAILASAALPLLFKAKQIEVNETNYFYSDGSQGGIKNVQGNIPITPLLELENCTHVIVNHLSDGSLWDRNAFSKAFPNTIVLEIRPGRVIKRQGLAKDLIAFDANNIQSWMKQGYEDTQRCCESVIDALHIHEIANQARKQRDEAIDELDNDNFHID